MDFMAIGLGRMRTRSCSATPTVGSRYTKRCSKCPRRVKNASVTRGCRTWSGSLKFAVRISTSRTEESLLPYSLPCNRQLKRLLRTASSLAAWSSYLDEIVTWLARNGLKDFDFGSACITLERILAGTKAAVWVRKKTSAVMVRISERTLNESEIQRLRREAATDYDELIRCGVVKIDIPRLAKPPKSTCQ